jgi:hypothetical protein
MSTERSKASVFIRTKRLNHNGTKASNRPSSVVFVVPLWSRLIDNEQQLNDHYVLESIA